MSLLDNLHEKALTTKKKHIKYPLLIASGIADWIAGTYDEIKGHGEAAQDSEDEKDYKLYDEGVKGAMLGEGGALVGAMYAKNKPAILILGADLLVRDANALISALRSLKEMKEDPDSGGTIDIDMTGAIGTLRTVAYKIAAKYGRSGVEDDYEANDPGEAEALIFPDPLPDPLEDDEMRILEGCDDLEPEEAISEPEDDEDDLLPFDFEPEPSPEPVELPGPESEPFEPEPVQLPAPGESYGLPDILGLEEEPVTEPKPAVDYSVPEDGFDPEDDNPLGDEGLDEPSVVGFETPLSKPEIDIGPLGASYTPPEADAKTETDDDDDEDPLAGVVDEDDTGNTLF